MTRLQAAAGSALVGPSSLPIEVTLACSGADALALCLAAIVAYPARWRMRAAGAAGGAAVILALNTIRIGTLGRHVEASATGELLSLDTSYVGKLKGVGKVWQITGCDVASARCRPYWTD